MSRPVRADEVKLVVSIFAGCGDEINKALAELSECYGRTDFVGSLHTFDHTDYYYREMGGPLVRRFVSFERLIRPEALPDIKIFCNAVEDRHSREGKRRVNLDPGYLSHPHLILATGKGYSHRPYLRDGIYADLTLFFRDGAFQRLPWTYSDYSEEPVLKMFTRIRERYLLERRGMTAEIDRL
ncbi:MAG: DUF4416 family protein [Smithellaceae bacterium]|nr:DUF4416 family protein [Smithellaceae bacterium]